jgi:hypothetical protein
MKFAKRRGDADTGTEPAVVATPPIAEPIPVQWAQDSPTAASSEDETTDTVVDADAVELPPEPSAADAVAEAPAAGSASAPRVPPAPAMPFPVAEQPVNVASSGPDGGGATPLGEAGAAYASGHASEGGGPSIPQPVAELAEQRPEAVVGAAFVGGLLLAMILRRLGN